jgi:hypothetical protein
MNIKQMEIAKKMGEHIASLNSLYEEFESANDEPRNQSTQLEKPPLKINKKIMKEASRQIYGN